jgi:hypothetical protein
MALRCIRTCRAASSCCPPSMVATGAGLCAQASSHAARAPRGARRACLLRREGRRPRGAARSHLTPHSLAPPSHHDHPFHIALVNRFDVLSDSLILTLLLRCSAWRPWRHRVQQQGKSSRRLTSARSSPMPATGQLPLGRAHDAALRVPCSADDPDLGAWEAPRPEDARMTWEDIQQVRRPRWASELRGAEHARRSALPATSTTCSAPRTSRHATSRGRRASGRAGAASRRTCAACGSAGRATT